MPETDSTVRDSEATTQMRDAAVGDIGQKGESVEANVEQKSERDSLARKLDTMANIVLAALMFLVPLFFIPSFGLSFQFSKGILFVVSVVVIFALWAFSRLKQGAITIPQTYIVPGLFLIPVSFLFATVFSPSPVTSFIGQGGEIGTFVNIAFLTMLSYVSSKVCNSRDRIVRIYLALFGSFALLSIMQLSRIFIGPHFLSFGVFTTTIANVFGKWNDVGVFYGLVAIVTLLALQMLVLKGVARAVLYFILAVALFFLALVDFNTVWFTLGVFSIVLGVYALSVSRVVKSRLQSDDGKNIVKKRMFLQQVPIAPIIVFVISFGFVVANTQLGDFFSQKFNITHIEARPSWPSTFTIMKQSLAGNILFGAGPNRFNTQWQLFRPEGINETVFWSTSFNSGIGHVPTFFVTTGVVGAAAWLLFFGLFLASGLRALFVSRGDRFTHFLVLSSFLASLYLWIFMVLYIPSLPLVIMAFLFTGLYVATLMQEKIIRVKYISFAENPKTGFLLSLAFMVAVCASTAGGYFVTKSFIAAVYYQQGSDALEKNDLVVGKANLEKAIAWHDYDGYYRLLASVNVAEINALLSKQDIPQAKLQAEFQRLFGEAKKNVEKARDLDETQYQNWVAIGNLYGAIIPLGLDDAYTFSKNAYDHALAFSPKDPSLYLGLARIEVAHKDLDAAREKLAEAIHLKSNYTEAIFFLSQIEVSAGNLGKAIESVEAAAIIAPDDPTVFFQLGLLKYNNNDNAGAITALERAISLNSSYANARYFLGLAYSRFDRKADAIVQFEEIEKSNPDNAEVKKILSNLRAGLEPFANMAAPQPEERKNLPIEEKNQGAVLSPVQPVSVPNGAVSE